MPEELRKKAEELLKKNPVETPVLSTAAVQKLFHELDVHQIELQMQNEELRKAQAELAHSRDAYVELYDFAPLGYLTLDSGGRILESNFTAATLLGVDRGKLLIGHTFAGFIHRDDLAAWSNHCPCPKERLERQGLDLKLQRPDGSIFTARIECMPRPGSGRCLLALMDMSQRVQTEEALRKSEQELALFNVDLEKLVEEQTIELRESEEKYRMVFESESDAIMIFDDDTRKFIDVNEAAVQLYGYTHTEFLQLAQVDIADEPEESDASIEKTQEESLSSIPRRMHRKKDGTVFPVEVTDCSFVWKGRPVVCDVVRDISQRINREQELVGNQQELRKLASELSLAEQRERQRVAAELHDGLSQLLTSSHIRLAALKESPLPEAAVEAVDIICGIIDESLQQTRALTFELSCPMLNELGLAASLEELCSSMTREHTVRFEFTGETQPLPLHLDHKVVLYRSVRELLINVMKHAGASRASVELEREGSNARIRVSDDGRGFDASMAGKGFSPSGGFGLFNIREYLQHAGGDLNIESIPGDGTRVAMTIPLEDHE